MASILVVDDDPDVLDVIATMVEMAGHDVRRATSGNAALDIMEKDRSLQLLLTDILMPGLNGFNLARMAKLRRPSLKVLYLTGFHETEQLMRDGGERYGKLLRKPILPADLWRELDQALLPA